MKKSRISNMKGSSNLNEELVDSNAQSSREEVEALESQLQQMMMASKFDKASFTETIKNLNKMLKKYMKENSEFEYQNQQMKQKIEEYKEHKGELEEELNENQSEKEQFKKVVE